MNLRTAPSWTSVGFFSIALLALGMCAKEIDGVNASLKEIRSDMTGVKAQQKQTRELLVKAGIIQTGDNLQVAPSEVAAP